MPLSGHAALGYRGYTDLQEEQRNSLQTYVESSRYTIPSDQVASKYEKYKSSGSSALLDMAIQKYYNRNAQNVGAGRAAEIIYTCDHVFVAGFRGMAGPAMSLGVLLHQYIPHVDTMCMADTSCVEKMLDSGGDYVVLLSSGALFQNVLHHYGDGGENHSKLISIVR